LSETPPGYTQTELLDPFEIHIGPVFERRENGVRSILLIADERHVNMRGIVHGGLLMTLADLAIGQAVWDATDHATVVTVGMQSQFLKPAHVGDRIEVTPQIMRRTKSLVFARGDFMVGGEVVYTATSLWKVLEKR